MVAVDILHTDRLWCVGDNDGLGCQFGIGVKGQGHIFKICLWLAMRTPLSFLTEGVQNLTKWLLMVCR